MREDANDFDIEAEKAATVRGTRRLLLGLLLAALLPALLLAYPIVIAPLRNDWAAGRLLEALLADMELPPEASVAETAAWAGNSSGTGNHVELWAGALIRYCGPEETAPGAPAESLRDWRGGYAFPASMWPEALFPTLADLDDWDGYYICGTYGDAVSQWDIRGH